MAYGRSANRRSFLKWVATTGVAATGNPPAAEGSRLSYAVDGRAKTAYKAVRAPKPGEMPVITVSSSQLIVLHDSDETATGDVQLSTSTGWTTVGRLDGGYSETDTGGVNTSALRIVWAEGTTAPVISEIIL